jgi:hypothetical protein
MQFGSEDKAKEYYDKHDEYFYNNRFERLRRITGYLVGSLERWNDGKKAEEAVRVKHSVNSCVNDLVRAARLQDQALAQNIAYVGHNVDEEPFRGIMSLWLEILIIKCSHRQRLISLRLFLQ